MKTITLAGIETIRSELDALLAKYNKENAHGLIVSLGNGSYTDKSVTFKTTAAVKMEGIPDGVDLTKQALDFLKYAKLLGLKESDLGRKFNVKGVEFMLCGYKPRSSKLPFVAKKTDGEEFVFPKEFILKQFAA